MCSSCCKHNKTAPGFEPDVEPISARPLPGQLRRIPSISITSPPPDDPTPPLIEYPEPIPPNKKIRKPPDPEPDTAPEREDNSSPVSDESPPEPPSSTDVPTEQSELDDEGEDDCYDDEESSSYEDEDSESEDTAVSPTTEQ